MILDYQAQLYFEESIFAVSSNLVHDFGSSFSAYSMKVTQYRELVVLASFIRLLFHSFGGRHCKCLLQFCRRDLHNACKPAVVLKYLSNIFDFAFSIEMFSKPESMPIREFICHLF